MARNCRLARCYQSRQLSEVLRTCRSNGRQAGISEVVPSSDQRGDQQRPHPLCNGDIHGPGGATSSISVYLMGLAAITGRPSIWLAALPEDPE